MYIPKNIKNNIEKYIDQIKGANQLIIDLEINKAKYVADWKKERKETEAEREQLQQMNKDANQLYKEIDETIRQKYHLKEWLPHPAPCEQPSARLVGRRSAPSES